MLNCLPNRFLLLIKASFLTILLLVSCLPNAYAQFGDQVAEYPVSASKFVVDDQRQRIYVSEPDAGNIVVIDALNLGVVTTIPVGVAPRGLAISSDGLILFVANTGFPSISLVDLETHMVVGEYALPAPPYDLEVDAMNRIYATPAIVGPGIMQIDGFSGSLLGEIYDGVDIYQQGLLELSPDKQILYFGNRGVSPAGIAKFDVSAPTPALISQTPFGGVGSNGQDLALTHDGQFISYAVSSGNSLYDIFKMQSFDFAPVGSFDTGAYPHDIVYSKDDSLAYTVHTAGQIDVFNTFDFTQQPPIPTIGEAVELEVSPNGRYLFAAFNGVLRVYDTLNAVLPLPFFPDPAMQQCMDELAVQNGWQFAEQVSSFTCSGRGVVDLWGLEGLPNLRAVDVSNNRISSISPLIGMSGLTSIDLSNNTGINPADLNPVLGQNPGLTHISLAGIPVDLWTLPLFDPGKGQPYALVELNLSNTLTSDLNRLGEFPGLQVLKLSGNQIVDINVMGTLNNLHELDLSNNQIGDISPLFGMNTLTVIDLSNNAGISATELFPILDQNRGLTSIGLAGIPVGDLWSLPLSDPFTGQPYALVELNLGNTQVSDINRLVEFPGLQVLKLSGNQIVDINVLGMLTNLRELDLSSNQVSNVSPLYAMSGLTAIDLSNNAGINPADLNTVLGQNPGLTHIGLAGIPVDLWTLPLFDPGKGQPYALVELNLSNTLTSDLNRLVEFPGLQVLKLSDNQITDIFVLDMLTNLRELDLSSNQISNISPLYAMSGLTSIDLSNNTSINPANVNPVLGQNYDLTHIGLAGIPVELWSLPLFDPTKGQPYALVELDLSNTLTSDLTRLGEFPGLQVLKLSGNQITNIAVLDMLSNLRQLDLSNNQISNIYPLFTQTNLTAIDLSGNAGISAGDLFPILDQNHGLTSIGLADIPVGDLWSLPLNDPNTTQPYALVELNLGNTQISDINRLVEFPGLQVLKLSGNQIVDINVLGMLTNLRELDLSDNQVSNISPLIGMNGLTAIDLSNNAGINPTAVNPVLDNNPGLTKIGLAGIPVDLWSLGLYDPSKGQPYALVELNLSNTLTSDLNRLVEFPGLQVLKLSGNQISDIGVLGMLADLRELDLGNNQITKIASLLMLPKLSFLNLMGNDGILCVDLDALEVSLQPNVLIRPLICDSGNIAPQLNILSPASGSSFTEGDLVTLQATAMDNEDGDISSAIVWSSNVDGALGSGGNLAAVLSVGAHTLTATVTDSGGLTSSVSVTVVVEANVAPQVIIITPLNGSSFVEGDLITLQASAMDNEDGDVAPSIAWSSNVDGALGSGSNVTAILSVGVHTISATVTDSGGLTTSMSVTVVVNANVAPQVILLSPSDGALFVEGDTVSLQATASDNEDGDVTSAITWSSNIDGALGTGGNRSVILSAGAHVITATVSDSHGESVSVSRSVVVNAKPTLNITSPVGSPVVTSGTSINLQATASDTEDGDLSASVQWSSNLDGSLGMGNVNPMLSVGVHTLTATVTDSAGYTVSASTTVTINAAPSISIVSPLDGHLVNQPVSIVFEANALDAEDGDISASIQWTSSIDGSLGSGQQIVKWLTPGLHTVTAVIVDSNGASQQSTVGVRVNAVPTVNISFLLDPYVRYTENDEVAFSGTASDLEDGSLSVNWKSNIDGDLGTFATLVTKLSPGLHTITGFANDSDGGGGSDSIMLRIYGVPTINIGSPINGAIVQQGQILPLIASANDSEDGDTTASIQWTSNIDGALGTGGTVNATLSAGTHVLTATVKDSDGFSASASTTVVVNTAPQILIAAPSNGSQFVEGDNVSLQATASDNEDGDVTAAISWSSSIDGVLGTGGNRNVILSVGTHVITAGVTDNHGATSSMSVTVVVNANVAPSVTLLSPSNGTSFTEGDVVSLQATASDNEDGDVTAAISWSSSIDGAIGSGGNRNAILSVGTHVITASVTDSHGANSSMSVTVVVEAANVAPTADAGSDQVVGSRDRVYLDGSASSDSDGSIVSYHWRQVSGTLITLNNADGVVADFRAPRLRRGRTYTLVFELDVTDDQGMTSTDQVIVEVR